MLLILSAVVVVGLVALIVVLAGYGWQESRTRAQAREDVDAVSRSRTLAESDLALLRTDLTLLASQLRDREDMGPLRTRLDELVGDLDVLSLRLAHADEPAEVTVVTQGLAELRLRFGAVVGMISGETDEPSSCPCFFNPNHGASSTVVAWTTEAGVNVRVPSCEADAERLRSGAAPYARTVSSDGTRVPWWEAGSSVRPWARGWYHRWLVSEAAATQAQEFASLAITDGSGTHITAIPEESPARRAHAS